VGKMGRTLDIYKLLFNERLKAICFTGTKIIRCKENPCSWKEIYGRNLKNMGVSQNTVSSILKAWEKSGILKKVKAPFPYKSKYQLVKETPEFNILELKSEMINKRLVQELSIISDLAYEKDADYSSITDREKAIGRGVVEDWEWFSKLIFLWLLQKGPGSKAKTSADEIAFYCFLLVDFLISSIVNLRDESREGAKRIIKERMDEIEAFFSQESFEKHRASKNMTEALNKALTIKP
jgi:DNA-binding Lrp family transcriptional regulator